MKIVISPLELQKKQQLIQRYLPDMINDKVRYYVGRFNDAVESATAPLLKKLAAKKTDINIDFASVDAKGNVITGEKDEFLYTPENLKKRMHANAAADDEFNTQQVEIDIPLVFTKELFGQPGFERLSTIPDDVIEKLEGILFFNISAKAPDLNNTPDKLDYIENTVGQQNDLAATVGQQNDLAATAQS